MEESMKIAVRKYIKSVKETECYAKYAEKLQVLQRYPELYERVNEYRKKNYQIQNLSDEDEILEKLEGLENEYPHFRENAIVDDFLRAELAFCRMMQEVEIYAMQELDFR